MTNSIKALLNKIIDYAGLFPPAKLPLIDAFNNFAGYQKNEYNWMLSNFIIPARKLNELTGLLSALPEDNNPVYPFSILGSGGETEEEFINNLKEDLDLWKKFLSDNTGKVATNAYEVKLPIELSETQDADKIGRFIESVSDDICQNISGKTALFFEGEIADEWRTNIISVIDGIKIHSMNYHNTGYKLRTGGTEASAFPSPEEVAYVLRKCLDHQIPMKCTAGLHHPVRSYRDEVNTKMHGFLNIFLAGAIAIRHNISEHEMIKLLIEENPDSFIFSDYGFSWNEYEISMEDIEYSRKALTISFGSCSFNEPVEDLKKLNLL